MSLAKWPQACPKCGSKDFEEIGRVEGGPDTQPHDVAIYRCEGCSLEFSTDDVPSEPPRHKFVDSDVIRLDYPGSGTGQPACDWDEDGQGACDRARVDPIHST